MTVPREAISERDRMVAGQIAARGVEDPLVLDAMRAVPREDFVPANLAEYAYEDGPLPIGHGQTISQPYIVAVMTAAARVRPGDRVLEIGTGSGYGAAVLSEIAGEVYTVERIERLADSARDRLAALVDVEIDEHRAPQDAHDAVARVLARVTQRFAQEGIVLALDPSVGKWLMERAGGSGDLDRAADRELLPRLAPLIGEPAGEARTVRVAAGPDGLRVLSQREAVAPARDATEK